jgi:hypothetical protein
LAGAVGFPLGHGAAADLAGGRKRILRHAEGLPQGAYAGANRFRCIVHGGKVHETD